MDQVANRVRVTLQDVADRAGVSLTTASRVVNEGTRRVGPQLAQRVNRAVAELGYTANLQTRSWRASATSIRPAAMEEK